jgi:hypothetical protein
MANVLDDVLETTKALSPAPSKKIAKAQTEVVIGQAEVETGQAEATIGKPGKPKPRLGH